MLIVIIGIVLYIIYRIKKGKPITIPLMPKKKVLPPYEEAVQALASLKEKALWQNGQEKAYYTEITEIIRHYIDRRFNVNAMEMTSTQLLELLTNDEVADAKGELRNILNIADFVKFAKMRPLADENEKLYRLALTFLDKTKPVEQEQPDQTEAPQNAVK